MNLASLLRAEHVGIRDLKIRLSAFLDKNKPLVVTARGKPRHFVVPYEEMLEIVDILEEASDPRLVAEVERARRAYKAGHGVPLHLSDLRRKLRLKR
jgi:hypothetical protein